MLRALTSEPERPYVVVLGGSKVSDKLAVIEALLPKVDTLLVGGGMCFTFLKAQGHEVGRSLLEADQVDTCRRLLDEAGDRIVLPVDVVCATSSAADADDHRRRRRHPRRPAGAGRRPAHRRAVRRGPRRGADGVLERADGRLRAGAVRGRHRGRRRAVAAVDGLSVVGGGDSAAAVRQLGLDESAFGHISTGGGASLEYLEGRELPGLAVLED